MKATSVEQLFTSAVQDASNRPIDGRFLPAANRNHLLANRAAGAVEGRSIGLVLAQRVVARQS